MQDVLIRSLSHRDRLTEREIGVIRALPHRIEQHAAGTDIVSEGDRPTHSSLVLSGMTARYNLVENGRRQISAVHIAGDFVDLHGFLLDVMDHSVVALSNIEVAYVPHAALTEITRNEPHLTRLLWLLTLVDAATHRQWLTAAGRLSSEAQLARFLCELVTKLEAFDLVKGGSFTLPMSQPTVGDALGLSPVHANRTIQDLRRRNLIAWVGSKVTVLDRRRLEELGEFDPSYLNLTPRPR